MLEFFRLSQGEVLTRHWHGVRDVCWGVPLTLQRVGSNRKTGSANKCRWLLTTLHSSTLLYHTAADYISIGLVCSPPAPPPPPPRLTSILGKADLVGVQEAGLDSTNLFHFAGCLRRSQWTPDHPSSWPASGDRKGPFQGPVTDADILFSPGTIQLLHGMQ